MGLFYRHINCMLAAGEAALSGLSCSYRSRTRCVLSATRLHYAVFFYMLILNLVFIAITSQISVATQRAQVAWIEKVQDRLRATTALLGDIKAIKMLALPQVVSTLLTSFRTREIKTSKTFRELLIATLMLCMHLKVC